MRRSGILTLALTFVLPCVLGDASPARAQPDSEDGADENPALSTTAEKALSPASKKKGSGKQKRRRRKRVVGHVVPDSQLRVAPLAAPSGHIQLFNVNTRDEADLEIFNDDGSYDVEELKEASHLLRCKRTDDEKPIDPRLIRILSHVYDRFGKRIEVVSGYRNQRKQTSYHFKGSATDIRIAGVPPRKLVKFASTLDAGGMGIGLYPRAKFVHIDVRPSPSYRWIDYSRASGTSPDKRPPRGWKRKKLQS